MMTQLSLTDLGTDIIHVIVDGAVAHLRYNGTQQLLPHQPALHLFTDLDGCRSTFSVRDGDSLVEALKATRAKF